MRNGDGCDLAMNQSHRRIVPSSRIASSLVNDVLESPGDSPDGCYNKNDIIPRHEPAVAGVAAWAETPRMQKLSSCLQQNPGTWPRILEYRHHEVAIASFVFLIHAGLLAWGLGP